MKKTLLGLGIALFLSGCNVGTTTHLPHNDLYQYIDVENTTKQEEMCDIYILFGLINGPLEWEKTSVMNIAKKGDIKTITYVDEQKYWVFPFWMMKCQTVYGY